MIYSNSFNLDTNQQVDTTSLDKINYLMEQVRILKQHIKGLTRGLKLLQRLP